MKSIFLSLLVLPFAMAHADVKWATEQDGSDDKQTPAGKVVQGIHKDYGLGKRGDELMGFPANGYTDNRLVELNNLRTSDQEMVDFLFRGTENFRLLGIELDKNSATYLGVVGPKKKIVGAIMRVNAIKHGEPCAFALFAYVPFGDAYSLSAFYDSCQYIKAEE